MIGRPLVPKEVFLIGQFLKQCLLRPSRAETPSQAGLTGKLNFRRQVAAAN